MRLNRIVLVLAVLAFSSSAGAQIVITQGSVMPVGTQWLTYTMMDLIEVDVGPAGANQTWTFGEYTFDTEGIGLVVDASGSEYEESFPTANCAIQSDGGVSYAYYRVAADAVYWLGQAAAGIAQVFEEESCLIPFPCSYQSAWTMVARYEMEYGQWTATVTDSILTTVDGWGTCNTQFGSQQVLRMFSHIYMRIVLQGIPINESEFLSYIWRPANGLDLVVISSDDGVTDPNFTTGYLELSAMIQAAPPPRGPVARDFVLGQNYPNPFNPSTSLPIELTKPGRLTLTIYDETGRQVSQQVHEMSAGSHQLNVDATEWAAGTYFARVAADAEQQTVKMQLVK